MNHLPHASTNGDWDNENEEQDVNTEKMTDAQIIEAVARNVMGWKVCTLRACGGCESDLWLNPEGRFIRNGSEWNPLTNHNAAFEVVEKMVAENVLYSMRPTGDAEEPWSVIAWVDGNRKHFCGTFCKAVCTAALSALKASPTNTEAE